jgi:hypothetical protein
MSVNTQTEQIHSAPHWYYTIPDYDGLEIAPVVQYEDEFGTYFMRTEKPSEAKFWTVYGHFPHGHAECIEDFTTEDEAHDFANDLLNICSNLRIRGISFNSQKGI